MTSTRPTTRIRRATSTDADTITAVLTEAFLEGPIGDWLISDLDVRRGVYSGYFRIHVEHALTRGLVDITTDGNATALWFPSLGTPRAPEGYERRLAAACGNAVHRFQLIDALLEQHHPAEFHHYLAFLAVAPGLQGLGIGSGLLQHHHTRIDSTALPTYLEASTERSRNLYLRHGYVLATSAPLHLPEDGPPVWPMWREPVLEGNAP